MEGRGDLPPRVLSALVGVLLLLWVLRGGLALILPPLVFVLWLGSLELRDMLAKRGLRLNLPFLVGGGVLLFLFSLPQLYWHFPQVPWREVALGLFLLGSFSYELLRKCPESFTPQYRFSMDSTRSPSWAARERRRLKSQSSNRPKGKTSRTSPV